MGTIVADIFHEVDEEVRRDQLKKLWDRYSIYLIALAVLIVVGMAAWRGYEYWVAKKAAAAGAEFEAAIALNEQGKKAEARVFLERAIALGEKTHQGAHDLDPVKKLLEQAR